VEVGEAIRRRRMVRSFAKEPLDPALVDRLLAESLRAPSAGNTRGVSWLVLTGSETDRYWRHATTEDWRADSDRYPGLSQAPVIALSLCSPAAYVDRYSEDDKATSGLGSSAGGGGGAAAWTVPYWFGDAAFSVMALLLGATAEGLAACFLGNFRGEAQLLEVLGVPDGWRLFGAVLLGRSDGNDRPSPSLGRRPAAGAAAIHRGGWGQPWPAERGSASAERSRLSG
jgi:nitroreductase